MSENQEKDKEKAPEKDAKENIVKSIFDKPIERPKESSLFTSTTKPAPAQEQEKKEVKMPQKAPKRSFFGRLVREKNMPIGIDIGYNSIKIAQFASVENRLQLSKLIVRELPAGLIENQEKRTQQLTDVLKDVVDKNQLKGLAYASISTNNVSIKTLSLPKMPYNEIDGAVKWEINRIVGTNINDISFDYIILDEEKFDELDKIEVLAVTSPKKVVFDHLGLLESVGLRAEAVEAESLALLAEMIYNKSFSRNEVVLVLDLGGDSTRLNIIRNNELQYSRSLSTNGNTLTKAIKDYCRISYAEAEKFKRSYGLTDPQSKEIPMVKTSDPQSYYLQIKNAITLLLEKLVSDIDHTFKYYSYQMTKSQVRNFDKILLSGGTANFQLLVPFLKERLNVPIEIENPLKSFEITNNTQLDVNNLKEDTSRLGVAIGLALRAIE